MKEKFTPGEWEIEEYSMSFGDTERFAFQILTPTKRICQCQTDDEKNIPVMQANAALIAAAPEMYNVLKRLVELTDYAELVGVLSDAKKTLKEARGEE
jgi:hypothetical protein